MSSCLFYRHVLVSLSEFFLFLFTNILSCIALRPGSPYRSLRPRPLARRRRAVDHATEDASILHVAAVEVAEQEQVVKVYQEERVHDVVDPVDVVGQSRDPVGVVGQSRDPVDVVGQHRPLVRELRYDELITANKRSSLISLPPNEQRKSQTGHEYPAPPPLLARSRNGGQE